MSHAVRLVPMLLLRRRRVEEEVLVDAQSPLGRGGGGDEVVGDLEGHRHRLLQVHAQPGIERRLRSVGEHGVREEDVDGVDQPGAEHRLHVVERRGVDAPFGGPLCGELGRAVADGDDLGFVARPVPGHVQVADASTADDPDVHPHPVTLSSRRP